MPKALFLPGYACTSAIWQSIQAELAHLYTPTYLDWPPEAVASFHTLGDFTNWAASQFIGEEFDFLVGHSLGGLVALDLAASKKTQASMLVLVESFLLPPPPFFQNLVLDSAQSQPILNMLAREKSFYSPRLGQALGQVNLIEKLPQVDAQIVNLYGDRGCGEPERVIEALGWPTELPEKVAVEVVANSCHFPMFENPAETLRLMQKWVRE